MSAAPRDAVHGGWESPLITAAAKAAQELDPLPIIVPPGWTREESRKTNAIITRLNKEENTGPGLRSVIVSQYGEPIGEGIESGLRKFSKGYAERYLGKGRVGQPADATLAGFSGQRVRIEGTAYFGPAAAEIFIGMRGDESLIVSAVADAERAGELDTLPSFFADGADDTGPLVIDEAPPPTDATADDGASGPGTAVLFSGELGTDWEPLSTIGGDFTSFASETDQGLKVVVPEGHSWGKTGIVSKDPVVALGGQQRGTALRLTMRLVPQDTSSFVVTLATRKDIEESNADGVRVMWHRREDNVSSRLFMTINRRIVSSIVLPSPEISELVISVEPTGAVVASLPDGGHVDGILPTDPLVSAYHVFALAHAPAEGQAADMALVSITRETATARDNRLADDFLQPGAGAKRILFDGYLGTRFIGSSWHGGVFADHASLSGNGLSIDVPPGSGWGRTGIVSPDPVLWLDSWGPDASANLRYSFDPARTTGFIIGLAANGTYHPEETGWFDQPGIVLLWRKKADGSGAQATAIFIGAAQPEYDVTVPDALPTEVELQLRDDSLRFVLEGIPHNFIPWPALKDATGWRAFALSLPDSENAPTAMALRSISLEQTADQTALAAAPRHAASPGKSFFDGTESEAWSAFGLNGSNFASFARWTGGQIDVQIPPGNSWGRVGLLSEKPLVTLDKRFSRLPYEFDIALAPDRLRDVAIAVSTEKQADMWPGYRLWVSLGRTTDGNYDLSLNWGGGSSWTRRLPASCVETQWDGHLLIDISGQQSLARLGAGGPAIAAPNSFAAGAQLFMTVQASPRSENAESGFALKNVSGYWRVPALASRADQIEALDSDQFDPLEFLKATHEEIGLYSDLMTAILDEAAP